MACTLKVEVDDDVQAWFVFVDRRPVHEFNRDFERALILDPGAHRLAIDVRGSGSTFKLSMKGAELSEPLGEWPLIVTVPDNQTSAGIVVEVTV